ncbi:MAG: hypothetical protein U9N30_09020, partial [Campylobacterota bacterium]|nr:hypothetical protein [Campylobacterota bacterium]
MSSCKKYLIFFFIPLIFAACGSLVPQKTVHNTINHKPIVKSNNNTYDDENLDILLALEYQSKANYAQSSTYFERLYTKTHKEEYLFELLFDLYDMQNYTKIITLIDANMHKHSNRKDDLDTLLVQTYLQLKQYKKAKKIGLELLKNRPTVKNHELLAKVHYGLKDYEQAYAHTIKAYTQSKSANHALSIAELLYKKLNKQNEAIIFLEDYANNHQCTMPICSNLLLMYSEQKNDDGTIKMLQKIYTNFKHKKNLMGVKQSASMLVKYLEQKNENLAMIFLEQERTDDAKLLQLYKKNNKIDQAMKLMQDIYLETSNINIIAQMAIFEFESAQDKTEVLQSVISKFKDALALVDNATYQN